MQHVCHILPLNGYLHRIEKHPTGDCPWCPGTRESQMHFHSECSEFEPHRTAAHHAIAKATISALRELNPQGWQFWYETPFEQLPFEFEWESEEEAATEHRRRPDGVAWHAVDKCLIFLEFSRPMDQQDNLYVSLARKERQYDEAVAAVRRKERGVSLLHRKVREVATLPIVVGVRGSVGYAEAIQELAVFKLSAKKTDRVLAAGVRAAVTAASDMVAARTAALPSAPPRGKQTFKPRPTRVQGWREDRGAAQG